MPPRSAKKWGPSAAKRARAARSTTRAENTVEVEEEPAKEEEVVVLGGYLEELTPERRPDSGIELNGTLGEELVCLFHLEDWVFVCARLLVLI